ncbi:glycoside hydrolase family 15 protein [Streptomyces sp. NPDC053253]|uniref:glycoside hydrolase family 15 protein n=1 Tax=Streptomyces sp. NPDC053253 TaxID=3365699 RepID=UPI0037D84B7C
MLVLSPRTSIDHARPLRRVGRIEDHGFIGNMRTAALVDRDGGIDWMGLPRFDSPAHFTSLLGTEKHGLWRIGPAGADGAAPAAADRRRYLDGTLILESTWITTTGTVQVLDFMPATGEAPQLVRLVRGVSGRVPMRSLLRARPGYGIRVPRIEVDGRRASADLGDGRLWLDTSAPTREAGGDLWSEFTVSANERVVFTLSWEQGHDTPPPLPDATGLMKATADFWKDWLAQSTYTGPHRGAVERSLITLKALTYALTGAIVAAPTTSLPEEIGGVRNWDYTFCWLRDSALIVEQFLACGFVQEARDWIAWLRMVIGGRPENLQVMYGVGGERDLPETVLHWLPGFENSAPVRIGNGAVKQLQLDVYGEVVSVLYAAQQRDPGLTAVVAPLITDLVGCLETCWEDPDEGVWEVRGPRRQFVHSKVMSWVGFALGVRLVESGACQGPVERWREIRDAIHEQVCRYGYDEQRNTFTQSYGSPELDASLLQLAITGFLAPDDKRLIGTIDAIQQELSIKGGFLLRYHTEGAAPGVDGLPGDEGAFLICSGWLVTALALIGRVDEAEILQDGLLRACNDLGLLAEEWDPVNERQLGNFPQGFSHVAVIQSELALDAARRGRELVGAEAGR